MPFHHGGTVGKWHSMAIERYKHIHSATCVSMTCLTRLVHCLLYHLYKQSVLVHFRAIKHIFLPKLCINGSVQSDKDIEFFLFLPFISHFPIEIKETSELDIITCNLLEDCLESPSFAMFHSLVSPI